MPFVKLDCGMLDSTTWFDKDARDVFITALLMAVPRETKEPLQQIEVHSLDETGWTVPPGRYGFVDAASLGILSRCQIEQARGMDALARLGRPEAESRSQRHDGRRLVRVDGGFLILNYQEYRDKDHTAADRQRRYRERQKVIAKNDEFADDWKAVVAFYDGLCAYCEERPWTDMDHITPTSKGGKHEISNVVPACRSCNSSKGATIGIKPKRQHPFMSVTRNGNGNARNVTQAEAEAEAEAEADIETLPAETPVALNLGAWDDYIAHRKQIRAKKLTQKGEVMAMKKLAKLPHGKQQECVDATISNGWTGLFPEKLANEKGSGSPSFDERLQGLRSDAGLG